MDNVVLLPIQRAVRSEARRAELQTAKRAAQPSRPKAPTTAGFRLKKRTGRYERANCSFDPSTEQGRSYGWWVFVERIGRKLVFNSYGYSNTTRKHQYQMRRLLRELGLTIDVEVESPAGLQDLASAVRLYERRIEALQAEIDRKGSRRGANARRAAEQAECRLKIQEVRALLQTQRRAEKRGSKR